MPIPTPCQGYQTIITFRVTSQSFVEFWYLKLCLKLVYQLLKPASLGCFLQWLMFLLLWSQQNICSWMSVKSLDVLQFSKSCLIQTLWAKQRITVISEASAVIANLNIFDTDTEIFVRSVHTERLVSASLCSYQLR